MNNRITMNFDTHSSAHGDNIMIEGVWVDLDNLDDFTEVEDVMSLYFPRFHNLTNKEWDRGQLKLTFNTK